MNNTIQLGLIGIATEEAPAYMAADFETALAACDPSETVYIDLHSEGGSVFEGFRIGNAIEDWPGKTVARVKVAAFSIASYIAIKCDEVEIAANGFFMIHNPYSKTEGDDEAHAQQGQLLGELKQSMIESYSARTGMEPEAVQDLMKATTYIGSKKAINLKLADRVIESTSKQRQLPKNHLPKLVLAAMYGFEGSGEPEEGKRKAKPMSEAPKKVYANVKTIRAAFPKASNDFVVKCMEEELTDEEVTKAHAAAMEEENETLAAKVAAMEEELTALKAKAMEEEEEETPEPAAQARAGVQPIAGTSPQAKQADPRQEWDSLIESFVAKGKTRQQAALAANRANPALRQSLLEAVN